METHSTNATPKSKASRADTLVTLVMFVVTIAMLGYVARARFFGPTLETRPPVLPDEPVQLDASALKGTPTTGLVLIEYSDFHCPACRTFTRDTAPFIDEKYVRTGKLLRVFRHYPSKAADVLGVKTAEAAACAGQQGKFWEMHGILFQRDIDPREQPLAAGLKQLQTFGIEVGLDRAAFEACLPGEGRESVMMDIASGKLLEIKATPTLLIGRMQSDGRVKLEERLIGAIPAQELAVVLDRFLGTGPVN
ncbi:MAG: DsbA family protein [Acidobacteriota bacterium]|nr:DsbA family protein [Acidobacteriota bacterium]